MCSYAWDRIPVFRNVIERTIFLNNAHLPSTMANRCLSLLRRQCWLASRRFCSVQASGSPAVQVEDERVQALLSQLTGLDLDKVFAPRKEPLQLPTYKLMTLQELQKAHAECVEQAKRMLHMPPVLAERSPRGAVIEVDEKLAEAVKNRVIFTDTTQHKEDTDRWIVVREVDGTLREANWAERDRMSQIFFPKLGRKMELPKMLQPHQLPEVLGLGHHLLVLDVVCVQCAPDSKEYIRVHKSVYDDIEKKGLYEMLWSTRYFGCLVWHLLTTSNITGLFKHMIDQQRLEDAVGLVKLYLLCYPESDLASLLKGQTHSEETSLLEAFCKCYGLEQVMEKVSQLQEDNGQDMAENTLTTMHYDITT